MQPDWLHFFQRTYPSANQVLIRGRRPILIDCGFGSDIETSLALLQAADMPADGLELVVNSHYHCDHSGGNHVLQQRYGLPLAAHAFDAELINRRDPEACMAEWLDQPVEAYRVHHPLEDGDELDSGSVRLRVVHTPGHSRGHICLYAEREQVLICGDAVHSDDVAWINPFTEGERALERTVASLKRLAALPVRWACSGHGPPMLDPPAAFAAALRRYERWQQDPQRMGWHACKRIFTYHLMLTGGMARDTIGPYLVQQGWFKDYSRHVFGREPADFVDPLLAELERSGATTERDGRIVAIMAHTVPPAGWPAGPSRVREWQ